LYRAFLLDGDQRSPHNGRSSASGFACGEQQVPLRQAGSFSPLFLLPRIRTMMKSRSCLLPILAGVVLAAVAVPVRGDEIQYLPNGAHVVFSVNFQDLLKSKTFAELKKTMKQFPDAKDNMEEEILREMGIPASNIARITMGVAFKDTKVGKGSSEIAIVTTVKPVTAAAITAARKPGSNKKNVTYKEIKVGKHTMFQESFQFQNAKSGEVHQGSIFCIVEDKLVLQADRTGGMEVLKSILERNAKPELSKNLQTALTFAPLTNIGIVVMDIQGIPERQRNDMFRGLAMIKDLADSFQVLAMKANEKDKFMGQAALYCKDADSAAKTKKAIESSLADLKAKIKDDPKIPAPFQDLMKAAREGLDSIKVSAEANQVNAAVSVEPALIGKLLFGLYAAGESAPPPDKEEAKEAKEKK
jgi:hypothetical protein